MADLFENRLEYQIGRLTLLSTVRWAEVQSRGTICHIK